MKLSSQQIRQLRAKAHQLHPIVMIGQHGLTTAVHAEIELALETHELIKIRIGNIDREHKKQLANEICQQHHAELVQSIGHIIAIYRQRPRDIQELKGKVALDDNNEHKALRINRRK